MPVVVGIAVLLGLDEAAVAALGVLLLASAGALGVLVGNMLTRLPWPLGALAAAAAGAIQAAIYDAVRWGQASAHGLATVLWGPWSAIWGWAQGAAAADVALGKAVWSLRFQALPQLAAQLIGYVQVAFAQLATYAYQLALQVEQLAYQLSARDIAYAQALWANAVTYAYQLAAVDLAYAQAAATTAEQYAQGLAATELAYTQAAVIGAERYAQALDQATLRWAGQGIAGAERYAEQIGVDVEGYARALQRQAIDHADAAAAAALAAGVGAAAAVATRVTALEDSPCQRFCSPLGDLGGLLQALQDQGIALLLLELAAELASDPQGAAQGVLDLVGGPLSAALDLVAGQAGQSAGPLATFERVGGPARAA